ncbi:uncharacterized protein J4E79_011681 [Alternaria viburni]|uniref:uncharacterized protein n=1 Tax=Alternaria viburni TaxID=566460 RepID=UPI0020C3097C|nr:uncharacterized protein J4E79_011681 [Alternaria viburni]KAI4641474.1 hypothetical protein J4E79_011681 [Alternaria viburni]
MGLDPAESHGISMNGLLQDFPFVADDVGLEGLEELVNIGDIGDRGDVGEVGELGGIGASLGDSYALPIWACVAMGSSVFIEALSSSSIPNKVVRSEYEFSIELTRVVLEQVLELVEVIVDIVISDALSEPEYDDAATPISCL